MALAAAKRANVSDQSNLLSDKLCGLQRIVAYRASKYDVHHVLDVLRLEVGTNWKL